MLASPTQAPDEWSTAVERFPARRRILANVYRWQEQMAAHVKSFSSDDDVLVKAHRPPPPPPSPPPLPPPPLPPTRPQGVWWIETSSRLFFFKSYSLAVQLYCPGHDCTFDLALYGPGHALIDAFLVRQPRQGVRTSQVEVTKDEASRVVEVMAQLALPGGLWSPAAALPPRNDPGSDWQLDIKSTPTVAYNKTAMEAVMSVKLASVPRCAAAGSCALLAVVKGLPVPHKIGQPYQREAGEAVYDASQAVQRIAIRYHNAAMEFTSVTIWLQRTAVPCFSDCQSKFFRYDLD